MILVITITETNENTGKPEPLASHGVDLDTGKNVVLPGVHPRDLGATVDAELNEWVIQAHR